MQITVIFEKTITRFGRTKVAKETITFNNWHNGRGRFQYNPPYVPDKDAHGEDSLWHAIGVWNDCEEYPFAPITTRQLQIWIDDWLKNNTIWLEDHNCAPVEGDWIK